MAELPMQKALQHQIHDSVIETRRRTFEGCQHCHSQRTIRYQTLGCARGMRASQTTLWLRHWGLLSYWNKKFPISKSYLVGTPSTCVTSLPSVFVRTTSIDSSASQRKLHRVSPKATPRVIRPAAPQWTGYYATEPSGPAPPLLIDRNDLAWGDAGVIMPHMA